MSSDTHDDPWRYRCPNGHTSWKAVNSWQKQSQSKYYCRSCQQYGNDPHFDELQDMKA